MPAIVEQCQQAIAQQPDVSKTPAAGEPKTGPVIIENSPTDLKQQAKQGEVTRTVGGITLALKSIKYEVRGSDYAVLTGIQFALVNEGSETISPRIAVYLWDDNDKIENSASEKTYIEVDGYAFRKDGFIIKDATVRIPFDDINLTKHIKLSAMDGSYFDSRTFISIQYDFLIKNQSKAQ
ncbi:hypothetical protein HYY73_02020 [Candidatus Woesearchaeota archaeon]|nr:hypothetical protein [Candidatus Woesearchaeota archaeon]